MSRAVQSQADVGNLSLAGLSAFSSILATLSADNVVPLALIQMGELGAALPTSGEYAEKVKSLLQRCSDVRLDHLAIVIGWRKNDSASLMAESAGGQAIALVSICLTNLFKPADTGTILGRLCSRLLSGSMNISSMAQLANVAMLLSGKLNTLGFGNLLAKEVTKIHQVYEALGKPAPRDLLEPLDTESAIELLGSISRALREDQKICRISGSRGMGYILGLIQALFRRNTVVTVEGAIIQDTEHSNIVCEIIQRDCSEPTHIYLETCIPTSKPIELPIAILQSTSTQSQESIPYTFHWTGWVADWLQLMFLNYGFKCDQAILDACCDLVMLIPAALSVSPTFSRERERLQPAPLLALLGPLPRTRMSTICKDIFRSEPTLSQMTLKTAFSNLVAIVSEKVRPIDCFCPAESKCSLINGWVYSDSKMEKQKKRCVLHQLWNAIGSALDKALWCFFVNTGPNTSISPDETMGRYFILTPATTGQRTLKVDELVENVMRLVAIIWGKKEYVAISSNSCTIYPTILKTFSVPSHQAVMFTLVEGNVVFEGRYHRRLDARPVRARPKTRKPLRKDDIRSSHNEMHVGNPSLTIREAFDCLEVLCSFKSSGFDTKVDLKSVILGYCGMRWTDTCHHPMTDLMNLDKDGFLATSVASPAAEGRSGVVMTRWNPIAQFLCCELGNQAIFVKNCCINCAAEGIDLRGGIVFIVA